MVSSTAKAERQDLTVIHGCCVVKGIPIVINTSHIKQQKVAKLPEILCMVHHVNQ